MCVVRTFLAGIDDLRGTAFDPGRAKFRFTVAIYALQTRAEVLQHYIDINAGGTPHSADEIERVRGAADCGAGAPWS